MNVSINIDLARYRLELTRFIDEFHADERELLKEEMRLLLRDIIRLTPPKSLAQGRNAVRGDLQRNAKPLDWKNIEIPRLAEAVHAKNIPVILAITKNLKGKWGGRQLLQGVQAIAAAHQRNRTRYGRVRSDRRNMAFADDWNKYTKQVQTRVGFTRAGWWRAAQGVGFPLPSWVAKHIGKASSGYQPPRPGDMSITAINRASKIPQYEDRFVHPAIAGRVRSLASELKRIAAGGKSRRASLAGTASGESAP